MVSIANTFKSMGSMLPFFQSKSKQSDLIKAQSQLSPAFKNQLYQALFQLLGHNMPIGIEENLQAYIDQGYKYNGDVYSIHNYILKKASTVSWKLTRRKRAANSKPEIITDHEIHELWQRPNPNCTNTQFIHGAIGYNLSCGNSYIYGPGADKGLRKGQALELHYMPAAIVEIVGGSHFKPVEGYKLMQNMSDFIPAEKVAHLKYWNPSSDLTMLYGLSPIKAYARVLQNSNDAFTANSKAFQNMGALGFINQKFDSGQPEAIFNSEQMAHMKKTWDEKYVGPENRGKVAFTTAAIEYTQLGLSPVDLAIISALKLNFQQLCRAHSFPSVLLNDTENSKYANYFEASKAAYTNCIMPELYNLAEGIHNLLVKPYEKEGERLKWEPDTSNIEELQSNKKDMVEWLGKAFWIKGVRKQEIMDEEPDAKMDMYFTPDGQPLMFELPESDTSEDQEGLKKEGLNDY